MTAIFSLEKWFEIVERGTSGDQVMDILYSWKNEKERLDKFVEAVGLLSTLKGDMQVNVNDPVGMAQEIERIAIEVARQYEQSRGWQVTSVESENRGFDLISRRQHPEDPDSVEFKYIEVKGRAGIGEISVTANEFKTAERLQDDYWLYVVYHCATRPEIHRVQNPARLDWQAVVQVEHYKTTPAQIIEEREQ